jgi:cyclase
MPELAMHYMYRWIDFAHLKQNPQMATMVGEIDLTLPHVVFDQHLTIYVGAVEIQLIRVGPAHSQGDAIAWLPQQRVLFAGDILFNAIVPAMQPREDSRQWVRSLAFLESLEAEHVIPGHGPIETPAALGALREWIEVARQRITDSIDAGNEREATIAHVEAAMQADHSRGREERLSKAINQMYDDILRERAEP